MNNIINSNNINNSDDSFEIGNNLEEFNSIEDKCNYYKQEYLNYKSKYIYVNNENNKLIKERNKLLFQLGFLKKKLKEIKSQIHNNDNNKNNNLNLENDFIIFNDNNNKKEIDNNNIINNNEKNIINDNDDNFDIEKELKNLNKNIYHENDILNESIFNTFKEESNEQNKILNELNNDKNNKELEEKVLLTIESMNFQEDEDNNDDEMNNIKIKSEKNLIMKHTNKDTQQKEMHPKRTFNNKSSKVKEIFSQKNIIINSILNSSSAPENDLNRTISVLPSYNNLNIKFDEDIIKKSLITEFIENERDSISFRKLIFTKEQKINNLYQFLRRWEHYSKILKKGIESFYRSIELFNKNLLNNENDSFIECPDLLGLIYLLQKNLNDIIEHCKSFLSTIDSLFILQLESFRKNHFQKIKIQRYNLALKISELIEIQKKFLSTKKSSYNSKNYKTAIDNYYLRIKSLEIYRFDYICSVNKILMMKQIEFPQLISLLTFSLMVFFRQIHEALKEIEAPIKDNLEKINARIVLKDKIMQNMKKEKKQLEEKKINNMPIDKNLTTKEGFINIREIDNNSNYKRRYAKINKGNLIYFKIKKSNFNAKEDGFDSRLYLNMVEKIDLNEHYKLCNLLLSNVKKIEKNYEYPFCFEIVDASTKKNYILQADTEKDANEWICAIQNAISDSISNFNYNSELKNKKKDNNNNNLDIKEDNNDNYNETINKIINENKCADCGAVKPTWLCLNWLTIICIDCSAAHRSLGANISKVKGFRLDNINNDFIELLDLMKQDEINKILESNLIEEEKPKPDSKNNIKEQFIVEKYKNKKYFEKNDLNINKEELIKLIIKAIDENNLLNLYKYIKQYIDDINEIYEINGESYGLLHYCAGKGKIETIKLLVALGGDINKEDSKGLKPIIYAKLNQNLEVIDYLNKKEKN